MLSPPANLFDIESRSAGQSLGKEDFAVLVDSPHVKVERIVSNGDASPPGFWYDQPWAEWVAVLAGSAGLAFENEPEVTVLRVGDHILIPPHKRHRVEWTDKRCATIWLAVHYPGSSQSLPI